MPTAPARHKATVRQLPRHQPQRADPRPSAAQRGYDGRWRKMRLMFLAQNPLCVDCLKRGRTQPANEVHHVVELRAGGRRLDPSNLLPLCKRCHSMRTGRVH